MLILDEKVVLGTGNFGKVVRGTLNNKPVAVKITRESNYVLAEIETHKKLEHRNIVRFLDSFRDGAYLYLALELMINGDLYELIYNEDFVFDDQLLVSITQGILAGLDYLSDKGIIHRDIKPENIVFNSEMCPKICDFGVSTYIENAESNFIVGTREYFAPELALSNIKMQKYHYSPSTDIYAFGVTLLETILRHPPYPYGKNLTYKHIANQELYAIPKSSNPIIADVITSCINQDPKLRASAKILIQLVSCLLSDKDSTHLLIANNNYNVAHFAAKIGLLDTLKKIIEYNKEIVNYVDCFGQTPLVFAASEGNNSIVSYLIEKGASVNVSTINECNSKYHNLSVLDWSLVNKHKSTAEILINNGAVANRLDCMIEPNLLGKYIDEGNLDFISALIKHNPDFLTQYDNNGYCIFHYAACRNQIKIVRYLIALGVDVNITTSYKAKKHSNMTALNILLKTQTHDTMSLYLIDSSANITSDYRILILGVKTGRIDIVRKQIELNPDIANQRDIEGKTALWWAAHNGYEDIVSYLISIGAEIKTPSNDNRTPLDAALIHDHIGCVMILKKANEKLSPKRCLFFNDIKDKNDIDRENSILRYIP